MGLINLETHFNSLNPFWLAPYGYGAALAFLALSLGFVAGEPDPDGSIGTEPPIWQEWSPWRPVSRLNLRLQHEGTYSGSAPAYEHV